MDRPERNRRLAALGEIFVDTPRTRGAADLIADLHQLRGGHEAKCALLLGPTGTGKTKVMLRYLDRHPASEGPEGVRRPVAFVRVPAKCTLRSLAGAILDALGDVVPGRGTQVELTRRAEHHLRGQKVELLMLDEFQHLIRPDDERIAYDAADWAKGLLWSNICPILLTGQTSAERIVAANPQLRRRTVGIHHLEAYDWRSAEDRLEYRAVLDQVDQRLGMPAPSGLGSIDTALRIHHFSKGLLGETMRLLQEAGRLAFDEDRPCLTHGILARAADNLRLHEERRLLNPFRVEALEPADPAPSYDDLDARAKEAGRVGRRTRGRRSDAE